MRRGSIATVGPAALYFSSFIDMNHFGQTVYTTCFVLYRFNIVTILVTGDLGLVICKDLNFNIFIRAPVYTRILFIIYVCMFVYACSRDICM